jgi:hypothetical protein
MGVRLDNETTHDDESTCHANGNETPNLFRGNEPCSRSSQCSLTSNGIA